MASEHLDVTPRTTHSKSQPSESERTWTRQLAGAKLQSLQEKLADKLAVQNAVL